ncbi:MAG: DUF1800 domain-containing protein [Bacteroidota bacterium]|nr:DUF1800 domain-containing protein [Kiloniellaceae bacterium]
MGVARALRRWSWPAITAAWLATAAGAAALPAEEARHLLSRSGFGATPADIAALADLDRVAAVAAVLDAAAARAAAGAVTAPPAWTANWTPPNAATLGEIERLALRNEIREQGRALKGWWLREMLTTPAPLTEVMTLFWHNHFTSSLAKVQVPVLLFRQNTLLRRHALGNFADLLHAIARDPAMLLYLDNADSRAEAPNENFAREMMELFTLGEGHYGEADLKDAARSFTGWSVDADTGAFRFRPTWHDHDGKTIFGRSGAFDGDTVIGLLLARPETAEFVVAKLWRQFVSERPDPAEVARLAALFRDGGYEITPLLAALFVSEAFWAPENRGRLLKSPVDLVVGTLRLFDLPVEDHRDLAWITYRLGQDLFDPPDVKGWPGGTAWITSATLLDRRAFLGRLTGAAGEDDATRAALFDRWVADLPQPWQDAEAVTLLLLPVAPVDAEVLDRRASGAQLRSLLADPAYQLK